MLTKILAGEKLVQAMANVMQISPVPFVKHGKVDLDHDLTALTRVSRKLDGTSRSTTHQINPGLSKAPTIETNIIDLPEYPGNWELAHKLPLCDPPTVPQFRMIFWLQKTKNWNLQTVRQDDHNTSIDSKRKTREAEHETIEQQLETTKCLSEG